MCNYHWHAKTSYFSFNICSVIQVSELGGSKSYEVLLRGSSVEPQTTAMDDKYVYNNEVLLRVTNHTGQAEKNLLGITII